MHTGWMNNIRGACPAIVLKKDTAKVWIMMKINTKAILLRWPEKAGLCDNQEIPTS